MPPPVLQAGARRRRLGPLTLLAIVVLAIGGTIGIWRAGPEAGDAVAAAPSQRGVAAPPKVVWAAAKVERAELPRALVTARHAPARGGFEPALSARGAILVDGRSGDVLWASREHLRLPIASTTKIMTAALALEQLAPRDVVVVDPAASRAAPFREGLRPHERVETWKLLHGLLLYSGNDSALALAIGTAGSRTAFLDLMNRRARELGLRDTHFTSPSGLVDRGNYSSAWDLAAITRYALRNPRFRTVVRTRVKQVPWAAPTYEKVYVNKNHLLGAYPGANGVKTGWTTLAKHCLVASASRGGVELIAVVLGSDDSYADARRLLDYGFRPGA